MFTFYDDIYQDEEKVWNLCYNELLGAFITFYSWVPSYSANIDTQFFTFDRDTSKYLSLLNKCNYSIPENTGVLVDNPVIQSLDADYLAQLHYFTKEKQIYTKVNGDGTTELYVKDYNGKNNESITFVLEHDHWKNYELFEINEKNRLIIANGKRDELQSRFNKRKVILLYVTPQLSSISSVISDTIISTQFKTEVIALTLASIVENPLLTRDDKQHPGFTTDFYLHGQAGIFNVSENVYPTYWYNKWHPFEFEFVVNDKIGQQKIFNNLVIRSNKAEPESFHFEIEGDNYEFSSDKRTMYFRQEATKNLYQNLGSDILYDRYYTDVAAKMYTQEQYYRDGNYGQYVDKVYPVLYEGLKQQVKSTIFPLYYERVDTYDEIYHSYREMMGNGYDFKNLSGSEILWNRSLNQFDIVTHIKNSPIDKVGRLRGNSFYKEGRWNIQIPSIIFNQKNEDTWTNNKPPIIINSQNVPNDLSSSEISIDKIPNIYTHSKTNNNIEDYIKVKDWTYRKEARIRDKWMKVRIRYSGKNLAIIHSVATLYNLSYS